MTGQTPARLGVVVTTGKLRETDLTWPTVLQENGYKTYFTGKWHLGDADSVLKYGFDINVAGAKLGQPADFYYPYTSRVKRTTFDVPDMEDGKPGDYLPDALTTKALNFIEENKDRPFLAYLSYYSVHKPGIPGVWAQGKKEYTEYFEAKLAQEPSKQPTDRKVTHGPSDSVESIDQVYPEFAAQVKAVDVNVGRVMAKLKELDIDDNTIVVFTSDQGSVTNSQQRISSAQPYRLGKSWLFEGGIRVPLIIRWPGRIPVRQVSDLITYNTDHFPTILDLLNLPLVPERHVDGVSIKQELVGNRMTLNRPYYWVYTSHQMERQAFNCVAYREGDFKLIHWYEHDHTELYDLAKDIGENHNLSYILPSKREQMKSVLLSNSLVADVVKNYRRRKD